MEGAVKAPRDQEPRLLVSSPPKLPNIDEDSAVLMLSPRPAAEAGELEAPIPRVPGSTGSPSSASPVGSIGSPEASGSPAGEKGGATTLMSQDPENAAWIAHQQRKRLMKEKKKNKVGQGNYLSNVGEVSEDVQFRFTFTVVATKADELIEATCNSAEAVRTGGGALSTKHGTDQLYRCMCEVTGPLASGTTAASASGKACAKLSFNARSFDDEPPLCHTKQDALNNAIVYALDTSEVDSTGESTFLDQLERYQDALDRLRASTKSRLRPVKALLLYSSLAPEGSPRAGLEAWAVQLADFEQERGDTWKFGPVGMQESDTLHSIFAEMTSARLLHAKHAADEPEDPNADEEPEPTFTPSAGQQQCLRRQADALSSASSSVSEQERPPCFDAEMSGSECSESAMELHARTFGIDLEEIQPVGKKAEDDHAIYME